MIDLIYSVVPKEVIHKVIDEFNFDIEKSVHGLQHWTHVIRNGLLLSDLTGANKKIIIAFAIFHDSKRVNENLDPEHGKRGAKNLLKYKSQLNLNKIELEKALYACEHHTSLKTTMDIDISTFLDADRLDLMRVFTYPDRRYLSNSKIITDEMIENLSEAAECDIEYDFYKTLLSDYKNRKIIN